MFILFVRLKETWASVVKASERIVRGELSARLSARREGKIENEPWREARTVRRVPVDHALLREMALFALEHSLFVTIEATTLLELLRELEALKNKQETHSGS